MKYALFLLPLLLLTACNQSPSERDMNAEGDTDAEMTETPAATTASMDEDEFVEACLAKLNWERPLCECADAKAKEQLSEDGYAFQIAALREDEAETKRLREQMPFEEIAQAGMFMVNVARECAEEGANS